MLSVFRPFFAFCVCWLVVSPVMAADIDGEVRTGARIGLATPATVQLLDGAQVVQEQSTDLDGRFEFRNVPAKSYTLRVKAPGFKDAEIPLTISNATAETRVPVMLRSSGETSGAGPGGSRSALSLEELQIPRAARKEYEAGVDLHRRGDCVLAVVRLRKAVSIYERFGDAYNELGNCSREMGRSDEAVGYFRQAIQYSSSIYSSINLADLYVSERDLAEATKVLQQALRSNPVEGDLYFALARIYFDQSRLRDAEFAALEAHSRVHRTADVHLLLAKIYLKLENYPALKTQLETYLIENPTGTVADEVRQNLVQLNTRR